MAQYGLETEVTTHLKGMQVGGNEQNGGGIEDTLFYKSVSEVEYYYPKREVNCENLKLYTADYDTRIGGHGSAIIIIHPDINNVVCVEGTDNYKNTFESRSFLGGFLLTSIYTYVPLKYGMAVYAASLDDISGPNNYIINLYNIEETEMFPSINGNEANGPSVIAYSRIYIPKLQN